MATSHAELQSMARDELVEVMVALSQTVDHLHAQLEDERELRDGAAKDRAAIRGLMVVSQQLKSRSEPTGVI